MKYQTQLIRIAAAFILYVLLTATFLPSSAQTIRRVTTTGTGDGNTWATASSLQAALTASTMSGDQVWIAAGTYMPHEDERTGTFTIPEGVLVYGGFDPTADNAIDNRTGGATILSGDLMSDDIAREDAGYAATRDDNSYTVVTVDGANVTLDGLTISGGERGTREGFSFAVTYHGAGLYGVSGAGDLTLQNIILRSNNAAGSGGGAYFNDKATVVNCVFDNNNAGNNGGGAYFNDKATVVNCVFDNNNAGNNGGGAYFYDEATVVNCVFANNRMDEQGGGAYFLLFSSGHINSTVTNSTFYNNSDNNSTGQGGGIYANYVLTSDPNTTNFNLRNSILINNKAGFGAPELYIGTQSASQTASIDNNLIEEGNVLVNNDGGVSISNIVDASDADVVFASTDAMDANYLRLKTGSPSVNAGNNAYLNNGTPNDTDDDITTDAAGRPRILDGTVDLGAYESGMAPPPALIRRVTPMGTGNGSTWATASSLQTALGASMAGDQVWIAQGTYKPDATDRTATFSVPAGVLVYGGFAGSEAALANRTGGATILSGDLMSDDIARPSPRVIPTAYNNSRDDNSYTVVTIAGANVTLNGLTITAGDRGAEVIVLNSENSEITLYFGAGLFARDGMTGTTLTACIFNNNDADHKGGGAYFTESAMLVNCTFTENTATTSFSEGGGAYFEQAGTLTNCTFTGNRARHGGGADFGGQATLTGCIFTSNIAANGGGARFDGQATLVNCTFTGNEARGSGDVDGGAISFDAGGTVINSTFYNNTAARNGGGILFTTSEDNPSTLQNNILIGNTAKNSGHQVYVENTDAAHLVNIQTNLIEGGAMGDRAGVMYENPGAVGITVAGTIDETDASVVFASIVADEDDFLRLAAGSPAVNTGNDDYLNNGTPSNTEDDIKTDAAGAARIQNGAVDLGAYEIDLKAAQIIAFTSDDLGTVGTDIELMATASSTLPVTFAITGEFKADDTTRATDGTVATLADGSTTLTLTGVGTVEITATQAGDANYAAATQTQTITVSQGTQTTFTLEGTALPTPAAGVENDGVQVNAIVTNIGGGEGDNDYYYLSNPVDGGAGMWQTGEDYGPFGIFWSDVTTTGTELSRVEANDLIRFNATSMVGTEVSLTLYALKDDDMSAATAGNGEGNFADFAAARTAFSDISDAQTLSVTVQPPSPTTFELGTLPNPVAGTENGGAQVSVLVTNVMDGVDGDSYYYVSELVDGGAGAWEENDGGRWSAITGTGFIVLESDDFIRFNASPGAVAGTVATLDFYVVSASSEPVDPGALPFISMAQTLSVTVQTSPSIRRVTRTGAGDGSTWATAMTLQAALMASTTAGDQVWIEAGTYKPHADDRTATFRIPGGVLVYGGFLGDEAALADRSGGATTLSGDLLGDDMSRPGEGEDGTAYIASRDDNSYSVVRIAGAGVTLDGLTITAGERGADIDGAHAGAGLYAMEGATGSVVSNCNFTNNSIAVPGVGVFEFAFGGGAFFISAGATLTNCTFTDNSAEPTGLETSAAFMFGGGLAFFQGAAATLTDCIFKNNNAGGGGGLAFLEEAAATLTDCVFENNNAGNGGGALFGTESTLTNCVFANNNAAEEGGGLQLQAGGTVTNSTFYNNTATGRGGGVYVTYGGDGDNFNLRNSIFVGNTDTTAGNAISFVDIGAPRRATDIKAVMDRNLIGGGEADLGFGLYDLRADTYTAVAIADATNVAITNMIEESDDAAVFTSTDASDEDDYLRLASGSPAVGAGDNNLIPSGIMTDAVGAVRIQDGTVDLGAYESEFTTPTPQTLTFTDPTGGTTVRIGQSIDLMATTDAPNDAMLAITFSSSDTSIAEIVNDDDGTFSLRLGGAGYVTITATQAGGAGLDGVTYARVTARQTIMVAAATVAATIRRVTTTGNAGEDGSSWTNAMTLQAALAESDSLDQVWIAAGTYKPDAIDRTATFSVPVGVLVYGGFDGAEDALADRAGAVTILSGDLLGDDIAREDAGYAATRDDNSNTVVTIAGDNATLDGLTITAGEVGTDLDGVGGSSSTGGAGLYSNFANTSLNACVFTNNSVTNGNGGGAYFTENTTLTDCAFRGNEASRNGFQSGGGGGGYFFSEATLKSCIFSENTANGSFSDGGGAYFFRTTTVTNCTFTENTANGIFSDGGGAYFDGVSTVINSTLYNNNADNRGGGLYVTSSAFPFILQNSILIGNTATDVASGHQVDVTNTSTTHVVNIQNNLIAGGADPLGTDQGIVYGISGSANVTEAGTVDESDATVVFASTDAMNAKYLRLRVGSPAVNAGNNLYLNNGTPGETNDDIKIDAAGNARIQGDTVDLGAYEGAVAVAPMAQAIAFTSDDTGAVGDDITLAATGGASGLDVTFEITTETLPDGLAATTGEVATLGDDGTTLTLTGVGTVGITATQSGNANYAAATQSTVGNDHGVARDADDRIYTSCRRFRGYGH